MAKGPIATTGTVLAWVVFLSVVFAIMVLWNWDPVSFIASVFEKTSGFLLNWEWFRNLVGPS